MKRLLPILAASVVAGALIGFGSSFAVTPQYVSAAGFQVAVHDPAVASSDRITVLWQDLVNRRNLSELIQRPSLDLYASLRQRLPLEDVMEQMRKEDVRVDIRGDSTFEVAFRYPDPSKAQAVVQEFTRQILQYGAGPTPPFRMTTAASLPDSPKSPDRLLFLEWGLGLGFVAGVVAAALWWRPMWTAKLIGYGVAGAAVTSALALFIPDQYVSKAMLRADVSNEWFTSGGSAAKGAAKLWLWMEQSRANVLSDASLSEIIQRPSLNLYPSERKELSMEDVIGKMRGELKIEGVGIQPEDIVRRKAFAISFRYPDPLKAQSVIAALVSKITDPMLTATASEWHDSLNYATKGKCDALAFETCPPLVTPRLNVPLPASRQFIEVYLLDPASLPETAESPLRWIIALAGMGAGLWLGLTVYS